MSSTMARTALTARRLPHFSQEIKHLCPVTCLVTKKFRTFSSTSVHRQLNISGIYPPITTPFNEDESIAYDKLKFNMDKWNKIPFKGYVVQGSTGEFYYLDTDERVQVVKEVVKLAGPNKLVIAGSGCESTRDTIRMTQRMADVGAKAVMVVTPCYYKGRMNQDALIAHYTKSQTIGGAKLPYKSDDKNPKCPAKEAKERLNRGGDFTTTELSPMCGSVQIFPDNQICLIHDNLFTKLQNFP